MWEDPIVKETREIREKYAASLRHDPDAIFMDIKERQAKSDKKIVSFPPKRSSRKKETTV